MAERPIIDQLDDAVNSIIEQRHDLGLRIDGTVGTRRIKQLFLAQSDGQQPLAGYLEGVDQDVADRVGATLREEDVVVAPGAGLDMADDQERVVQQ